MNALQGEVFDWILKQEYEFKALAQEEKQAISEFSVLWSYFEAKVCGTDAKVDKLRAITHSVAKSEKFDPTALREAMVYFRARYLVDGEGSGHFDFLHIRNDKEKEMVLHILNSDSQDLSKELEAALYIVYRYRNNLFHGAKWMYGIRDQKQNFLVATELLKSIISAAGQMHLDIAEQGPG